MFYTYLWAAFIVELLVGILVGWSLATLHLRRKESLERALIDQGARDLALNTLNGSAMNGKVGVAQAIAQDRSSVQMRVQELEDSLAETQTLYETVNSELQFTRQALAESEATSSSLDLQIQGLTAELAEGESKNTALHAQVNYFQKAAADAQTLINTLNETTYRLQSELDEAQKSRERLNTQLSVYKEKMHVAIAQLERVKGTKKIDVSA